MLWPNLRAGACRNQHPLPCGSRGLVPDKQSPPLRRAGHQIRSRGRAGVRPPIDARAAAMSFCWPLSASTIAFKALSAGQAIADRAYDAHAHVLDPITNSRRHLTGFCQARQHPALAQMIKLKRSPLHGTERSGTISLAERLSDPLHCRSYCAAIARSRSFPDSKERTTLRVSA